MSNAGEKPKIIVDEDWKSQVMAEKEAAEKKQSQADAPQEDEAEASTPGPGGPIPPASLTLLFTTLATQAMLGMGEIPHPITGKTEILLDQARHFIDMLALLEEKTAGNRTADESAMLSAILNQLRMGFVLAQKSPQPGKVT